MAQNVIRPTAEAAPKPAEVDDMMADWEKVGPWYSRGLFWLSVTAVSVVIVVIACEWLASGVGA
ncbi:MAG: hypothetical protein M0Z94_11365 [Dehalococcoidales bacterium]|nr:hypothetical protein [Dehalococcoidales bacterium]